MTRWQSLVKERLDRAKRGTAPTAFSSDVSLDDQLRSRVEKLEREFTLGSPFPHEPALVEPLLGDVAALLDRCLSYQREASELEIKWVRQQLESQLSSDLSEVELRLAVDGLGEAHAAASLEAHARTAAAFSSLGREPLAKGFAQEATSAGAMAQAMSAAAASQRALLERRSELIAAFRADFDSRHDVPGGAHNFLERYNRVTSLLFEDFDEAYRKAKCVAFGMGAIFGVANAQPPELIADAAGPLFGLIRWTRQMMRKLEVLAESELEMEVVIPLVEAFQVSSGRADQPPKGLITRAEYNAAMKDGGTGRLSFRIETLGATRVSLLRARVVGVGLSFVNGNPDRTMRRFFATIIPPEQAFGDAGVQKHRRPAIPIGTIFPYGPQFPVARIQSLATHNLQFLGEWNIYVQPFGIDDAKSVFIKRTEDNLLDCRLHLTVVAQPGAEIPAGG